MSVTTVKVVFLSLFLLRGHRPVTCMLPVIGNVANTCINLPVKREQSPSARVISTNTANTCTIKARTAAPGHYGNRSPGEKRIHRFQEWAPLLSRTAAESHLDRKPHPALCPSDGLRDWGQAEPGPRGLGLHGALVLPRRGPGCHRGIPAGALAGGAACTAAFVASGKHGPADAFPAEHQDLRLARLEERTVRKARLRSVHGFGLLCVRPTVNSWSGQHPYRWHCGSHTPQEEYENRAFCPDWPGQHDEQWVSSTEQALTHKLQQL